MSADHSPGQDAKYVFLFFVNHNLGLRSLYFGHLDQQTRSQAARTEDRRGPQKPGRGKLYHTHDGPFLSRAPAMFSLLEVAPAAACTTIEEVRAAGLALARPASAWAEEAVLWAMPRCFSP